MRNSQSVLEYLLMIGVIIIIVMIVLGYVATYTESEAKIATKTANESFDIISNAIRNATNKSYRS